MLSYYCTINTNGSRVSVRSNFSNFHIFPTSFVHASLQQVQLLHSEHAMLHVTYM